VPKIIADIADFPRKDQSKTFVGKYENLKAFLPAKALVQK
jgi:hypothetical protein